MASIGFDYVWKKRVGEHCVTAKSEYKLTGIQDLLAEDAILKTTKRQFCFKGFFLVFWVQGSIVRAQETWPPSVH